METYHWSVYCPGGGSVENTGELNSVHTSALTLIHSVGNKYENKMLGNEMVIVSRCTITKMGTCSWLAIRRWKNQY